MPHSRRNVDIIPHHNAARSANAQQGAVAEGVGLIAGEPVARVRAARPAAQPTKRPAPARKRASPAKQGRSAVLMLIIGGFGLLLCCGIVAGALHVDWIAGKHALLGYRVVALNNQRSKLRPIP